MAWRVVHSLEVLRDQFNQMSPHRSRASDGTIGDTAHQSETSDHNPAYYPQLGKEVVCALDITHDPAHGVDTYDIAEIMRQQRDPRVGYIISNRRITGPNHNWKWDRYTGTSDPHTNHMHVSTVHTRIADDRTPWVIQRPVPIAPEVQQGDEDMAIIAKDSKGQYYFCIGYTSYPLKDSTRDNKPYTVAQQIGDIDYLAQQGAYDLARRGTGSQVEWEGNLVRLGWTPEAFGPVANAVKVNVDAAEVAGAVVADPQFGKTVYDNAFKASQDAEKQ